MTEYWWADEVRAIAEELIPEHHPHLEMFTPQIRYVFRDEATKSNGKTVLGKARKISGLNAFLAGGPQSFHLIEIAHDTWQRLGDRGRRALVDHELCHCDIDEKENGDVVPAILGHDIEEFAAIVQRYGLWSNDLIDFVKAGGEQLRLDFEALDSGAELGPGEYRDGGGVQGAMDRLLSPLRDPRSGIDSMTISAGGDSTTIHADDLRKGGDGGSDD